MRIVAKFFSEVVEVSGKTQLVENIKTNSKYWREQVIYDLQHPSALDEWYTPEPNTAHAFLSMLKERKEYYLSHGSGQNHVELLEMEDVAPMPYDEPFTGEPGDHVRVVALVDGQRVEVSGATQQMAMLKAESPLYEQIRIGMLFPPPLRATYGPDTDSALAFLSVLNEWQLFGKHSVEILVVQNIAAIPSEPGVVY